MTSVAGHALDRSTLPLLLTLGLGVFAGALDLGVLSPALPAIAETYGVSARYAAWIFTLYLLANVTTIPIATKLSDTFGRRSVYVACVATFAAGSVLAIVAPSFWIFLLARALQAAGAGGIFPVATAAIADCVPQERRGAALGLVAATWGLAAIIGPNIGGVVTHFFSWHWIFAANVPLAIVVIVLARAHVPTLVQRRRGPLDIAGIALLSAGLLAVMIGLTRVHARGTALVAFAIAALAFAALAAVERRAAQPVIAPALFRSRQIVVTYCLEVFIGALEGALFFIPAALVAAQHVSYAAAGALAAAGAFVFVAVIPIAGRALDAVGSRVVLAVGTTCTGLGLALFAANLTSLPGAIAGIVVAGFGFGALLGAPTRYIVSNEVPAHMRATAIGLLSVFLIVGQIVGGSLAGGLVGSRIDDVAGYRHAFEAFTVLAIVTFAGTFALRSRAAERAG